MIHLYRLLFLPALLVILPFFLWRTRGRGGWRTNFANRFGSFQNLPAKRPGVPRVWLQAVSVGELLAVIPLIEELRRDGRAEIFLTTTTTTGFALARERLGHALVGIGFFPVDFWLFSARAWRAIAPDVALLAEGERWPEHIHQAARRGVPVVCVNARMSERGFRRARALRAIALPCWRGITLVLAATVSDGARFGALGFDPTRVRCTGNLKLDVEVTPLEPDARRRLREELRLGDELLIVGASTWAGEESVLIELLRRVRAAKINARMLIVPRHVERRQDLGRELETSGFSWALRSRGPATESVDIIVGDTTGELRQFVQLADLVFVGRSLPPHHEGQTPIEAVQFERAVIFGPGMSNFRDVAASMLDAGAAVQVKNADEFWREAETLLADENRRTLLASAARQWSAANRGALARTMAQLEPWLKRAVG